MLLYSNCSDNNNLYGHVYSSNREKIKTNEHKPISCIMGKKRPNMYAKH